MLHRESSKYAGKTLKIKADVVHPQIPDFGGSEFRVEDWWDKVTGGSWMNAIGNPAALIYAARSVNTPIDDEVLYGKVGPFGHLVHISELEID